MTMERARLLYGEPVRRWWLGAWEYGVVSRDMALTSPDVLVAWWVPDTEKFREAVWIERRHVASLPQHYEFLYWSRFER